MGKVAFVVAVEVNVRAKFPLVMRDAEALFAMVSVPAVVVIMRPLMLVAVAAPRTGVTNVGDVENTRLVEVVPVVPAAVNPVMLLKQVIDATEQFVPPFATGSGLVMEITPAALIAIGGVAERAPPFVVVAHVVQVALPVAVVIAKGAEAVTAGVPVPVPHVIVGVPAPACATCVTEPEPLPGITRELKVPIAPNMLDARCVASPTAEALSVIG